MFFYKKKDIWLLDICTGMWLFTWIIKVIYVGEIKSESTYHIQYLSDTQFIVVSNRTYEYFVEIIWEDQNKYQFYPRLWLLLS